MKCQEIDKKRSDIGITYCRKFKIASSNPTDTFFKHTSAIFRSTLLGFVGLLHVVLKWLVQANMLIDTTLRILHFSPYTVSCTAR